MTPGPLTGKKKPLHGPQGALRAAPVRARASLRGMHEQSCARQMHMPTHIMKAGFCVASSLSGLHTAEWARVHYLLLCFALNPATFALYRYDPPPSDFKGHQLRMCMQASPDRA